MIPTLILLLIIFISLLAMKLATSALMITGLSYGTANFQAYSAYFGVGFTTRESELVVNHPVRRRIIRDLILVGNIGVTSSLATIIITFVQATRNHETLHTVAWLGGGALIVLLLLKLPLAEKVFEVIIRQSLKWIGLSHKLDYELLLRVQAGYCISEIEISATSSTAGKHLRESRPSDQGIIILGIQRGSEQYIGAPGPEDILSIGDMVTIYGREQDIDRFLKTIAT